MGESVEGARRPLAAEPADPLRAKGVLARGWRVLLRALGGGMKKGVGLAM